jgi:DNA-binding MarR family transcriptional regulator
MSRRDACVYNVDEMKFDLSQLSLDVDTPPIDEDGYVGLAGVRRALRRFLSFSEVAATSAGITTQQYQAMLAIRASRKRALAMRDLAEELLIKPNGAVQLVDRLEAIGMVRRDVGTRDRRVVLVSLTGLGERVIAVLAAEHVAELLHHRPLLVESLRRLKSMTT